MDPTTWSTPRFAAVLYHNGKLFLRHARGRQTWHFPFAEASQECPDPRTALLAMLKQQFSMEAEFVCILNAEALFREEHQRDRRADFVVYALLRVTSDMPMDADHINIPGVQLEAYNDNAVERMAKDKKLDFDVLEVWNSAHDAIHASKASKRR